MCCNTHEDRDVVDRGHGIDVDALLAASEDWRCRCPQTSANCRRKATGEDLLCDWCRVTDHMEFCNEVLASYQLTGSPYGAGRVDFYAAGRVGEFFRGEFAVTGRPLPYARPVPLVNSPLSGIIVTGSG